MLNRLLRTADRIVTNSEIQVHALAKMGGIERDRFTVIPNTYGAPVAIDGGERFRARQGLSTEPYALMIGQVGSPGKSHDFVFRNWRPNYPPLYVIGGVADTQICKEVCSYCEIKWENTSGGLYCRTGYN